MSTAREPDQQPELPPKKGAEVQSMRTRVSDLLDDVTVSDDGHETEIAAPAVIADDGKDQPGSTGTRRIADSEAENGETPLASEATVNGYGSPESSLPNTEPREVRSEPQDRPPTLVHAIRIRGKPGGVSVEIGEGEWQDLLLALETRLADADGFFRGGKVVLELGSRAVDQEELCAVRDMISAHEMKLTVVRSSVERSLQAAIGLGIATSSDHQEDKPSDEVLPAPPRATTLIQEKSPYFVYRGHLRSGQVLRKAASIVVLGDVNPGAQVISAGDVMVWGRLRGIAYAGANGDQKAVVAALRFMPTQLRIAHLTTIPPKEEKASRRFLFWKKKVEKRPEVARIVDERIVVEPWDETKQAGFPKWRP